MRPDGEFAAHAVMEVFLLPVGTAYELYCEVPDESPVETSDAPRGFFRRMADRFNAMLAEAERERLRGQPSERPSGLAARLKRRMLRWVAESIAEQRLLWHLRRQTAASLVRPDDLAEDQAAAVLRARLSHDYEKHRFWLLVDSLAFLAGGLLFWLPGPNVIAYYFAFRAVGHYLSSGGARQGLNQIEWRHEPSAPLSTLRRALDLEAEARDRCVQEVAEALRLEHLPRFFARIAIPAR